jgi:hypothetical protein
MVHAVWHGTQEKYQIFDTLGGRFNSEFGMEAFPHIDTIRYYCTDPTQLYPQSHMLDFHNKADGHERRIATYLVENFRTKTDLEVRTLSICAVICSYVTGEHSPIRFYANTSECSRLSISHSCHKQKLSCLAIGDGDVNGGKSVTVEVHLCGSSTTAGQ